MAEIQVNLDAEAINQAVSDAIIKSAIGVELEKVIKEQVEKISRSYDSPIKSVVARHVEDCVRQVVQEQYGPQIRSLVAEKVTEKFTTELFEKLWQSFVNRF